MFHIILKGMKHRTKCKQNVNLEKKSDIGFNIFKELSGGLILPNVTQFILLNVTECQLKSHLHRFY